MNKKGCVYIVGAGPGDHRLISVKGLETIKKADVIIYDRLVSPRLLSYAKPGARLIYVGKASSDHTMRQEDMNVLIADEAAAGNIVCRLKGGDPYIFGRGGEEALLLNERGIRFEVVPGISAFASVPAYAGIPVTHRGYTATAAIVTGHEDPTKESSDIDWPKVSGIGTLVFFMGIKNLPDICENLIKYGKRPETPAAVIQWGTTTKQRTVTGTLETIDEIVKKAKITPPAIFMVSETVELREKLNWFETLPLFGKKIVVTRAREQASDLVLTLEEMGADVIEFPMIKIAPPDDGYKSIDAAIENIGRFDLVIFTSVNGVTHFLERLRAKKTDIRCLAGKKIAAIGEKTAEELEKHYLTADMTPSEFKAEALIDLILKKYPGEKLNILIARAQEAREVLPEKLAEAGHIITMGYSYKMLRETHYSEDVFETVKKGEVDLITFASSGTVLNFIETIGSETIASWFAEGADNRPKIAAIGPVTSDTCAKNNIPVDMMPAKYTIEALSEAIAEFYRVKC